jgi:type I restriction enzyme R subunit
MTNYEGSKPERITQNRIIDMFTEELGYTYLGNYKARENNSNVEEELLKKYLKDKKGYSNIIINRAINELLNTSKNQGKKLYFANKDVYELIRYGTSKKEDETKKNQSVEFIDFKNVYNNDFYIAEEVTIKGENKKRPDLVLYVNGIALGVIELKRSKVSVAEGIRQNLDNQQNYFIKPFFNTMQLVMAGNDSEGLRYGTIETSEKYYLTWKEDIEKEKNRNDADELSIKVKKIQDKRPYNVDKHLIGICHKERFLEIIHDFIVFDMGRKKLCRPNQYFGVNAAIRRIKKREGGVIWHTQGSGKSLTMVWLAKWIRENIPPSRILIVTDREELDEQIEGIFLGVEESIYRAKSGKDLIEQLNKKTELILCSLIHKFGKKNNDVKEADYDKYIEEIKRSLPKGFKAKGDIYVYIDECHRTQSGKLHRAMKTILPNAILVGFTGTPLLKSDKATTGEVFGTPIHTYKFDEAVKDGVILDLQYEARDVDQDIYSQDNIDKWFEANTRGLTEYAITKLKKRWGTMQKVRSSEARLQKIANDIYMHMMTKDRLLSGKGNAMLVAGNVYEACKYYEIFNRMGFNKCAIITSFDDSINSIKGETTGELGKSENIEKREIYQKMLNGKSKEDFEKEVKKQFKEAPDQMKLLIVVDKLLTGFDAPSATYLYIDKSMKDHGLFQAICRVNRLDDDSKEYGYIIDYMDLFDSLEQSVIDYTTDALGGYEQKDVDGLLKAKLIKGKEKLDMAFETISALCEPVAQPKDDLAYMRYFVSEDTSNAELAKKNESKRKLFYKCVTALVRAYSNITGDMEKAGYSKKEIEEIRIATIHYNDRKLEVMRCAGEYIELKSYESAMRHLLDNYISAKDSRLLSSFEEMPLIELIVENGVEFVNDIPEDKQKNKEAMAETVENNVRKLIIDEAPTNPIYYEKMSKLLDEIIKERKEKVINYEEYLKKIVEMTKCAKNPAESGGYPSKINTKGKRALFEILGRDEENTIRLHTELIKGKPDGWRDSPIKIKKVKQIILKMLNGNSELMEVIFDTIKNQGEY